MDHARQRHSPDPILPLELGIRYLARRRGRAALTSLGVAAVVAVYLGVSGGARATEQDIQTRLEESAGRIIVQQPVEGYSEDEAFPALTSLMAASEAEAVLAAQGADPQASSAVLFMPLTRVASPGEPPAVLAVGVEPGREAAFLNGVSPQAGETTLLGERSVVLGARAARYYAQAEPGGPIEPGDEIEIAGTTFDVVGVLEPGSALIDRVVLLPLRTAQDLFFRPGVVSAVILHVSYPETASSTAAALRQQYPGLLVIGGEDEVPPVEGAQDIEGGLGKFLDALSATVLLVAVLMISIVMVISVADQRRQIGILRALGAGRSAIAGLVLSQSVVLSAAGTLLAWPVYALVTLSLRSALAEANIEILVVDLLPSWTRMVAAALIVGGLSTLWPAWQALRVTPLEAMRTD
jgi:putative ABC transport system permease protein